MATSFVLNGKPTTLDADPNMPLLWAMREVAGLPGTKFGCGMALCGACTVHLDGQAIRSCVMPLSAVAGRQVTTIEGLQSKPPRRCRRPGSSCRCRNAATANPARSCPQPRCSKRIASPTDADIDGAMSGNICRCATYSRIRAAIHAAAQSIKATSHEQDHRAVPGHPRGASF